MFESHPVPSAFYCLIFLMTLLGNLENYYEGTWDFKIKGGISMFLVISRNRVIQSLYFFAHQCTF